MLFPDLGGGEGCDPQVNLEGSGAALCLQVLCPLVTLQERCHDLEGVFPEGKASLVYL